VNTSLIEKDDAGRAPRFVGSMYLAHFRRDWQANVAAVLGHCGEDVATTGQILRRI
jgi:hypothetical protein